MSNIIAVFQSFRCPNCDTFFSRTFNLERQLTTCSGRVKKPIRGTYIKSVKLSLTCWTFSISSTQENRTLLKYLALFDFESIFVQKESLKDTMTTTWIGKHVPISVSISSSFLEEPTFLYNTDLHHLVSLLFGTPEGLAPQSKAQMNLLLLDIETTIKIRLASILEKLTKHQNRREHARFDMSQEDCDKQICSSTQFLPMQKIN